jgi:hypothetical protein
MLLKENKAKIYLIIIQKKNEPQNTYKKKINKQIRNQNKAKTYLIIIQKINFKTPKKKEPADSVDYALVHIIQQYKISTNKLFVRIKVRKL